MVLAHLQPPPVAEVVPTLAAAVLGRAGLDPAAYRAAPLSRRVAACLRLLRADDPDLAVRRLEASPASTGATLSTLLIGVSAFFRDAAVFDTLRQVVLPTLGRDGAPPRILSVGCSYGSELYSVAMLLAEQGRLDGAQLVGVDCRDDAIAAARVGIFGAEALDGLDEERRRRHFHPVSGGWRIAEPLRCATSWARLDAIAEVPTGPWDLVLCRNLTIYLTPWAGAALHRQLVATLSPGGYFVVGKAERPAAALGLAQVARCVHRTHAG